MSFLERTQLFLAGMFLSLGLVHFEIVNDLDQAAFWVTGAFSLCWVIEAIRKGRDRDDDLSAIVGDAKGS